MFRLNEVGQVERLTHPDSYYIERSYDELERLTDIKLNGAMTSALLFEYDELSRRTKLTYENGVETDYGFDANNDVNALTHTFTASSVGFAYTFNGVHELQSQLVDNDAYLWHPTVGATVVYGVVNGMNQYPSVDGDNFDYNDNGCLVDNDVWQFGYDAQNQLVSATDGLVSASYIYDPHGRQAQKSVGGVKTRFIHSGVRTIAEYDDAGNLSKRYVYGSGSDEVLLEVNSLGEKTYLHLDRIGSVIATTDDTGTVLTTYAYSPWGECASMNGTSFGFQGQRFDAESGLYFMKARHYDPRTGRFLQPDPIGYDDGLNLYQFAYDNPNSFRDPLGLSADGSQIDSNTGAPLQGYVSNSEEEGFWTIQVSAHAEYGLWTTPGDYYSDGTPEEPTPGSFSPDYTVGILDALSMSYLGDFLRNPQQALSDWAASIDEQRRRPDAMVQAMLVIASIALFVLTLRYIFGQLLKSIKITVKPPTPPAGKTAEEIARENLVRQETWERWMRESSLEELQELFNDILENSGDGPDPDVGTTNV